MRYASTPGWVNVMLIVLGLGFMAGAVAFIVFVPPPTGVIVGVVWIVMGAGFVVFSLRAMRNRRDDDRIRRQGTPAKATLLSAKGTSWVVNGVPQWVLRLRIDGAGASYETNLKLLTYSPPQNGATFTVRIDPLHRDHVALANENDVAATTANVEITGDAPDAAETVRLLADLDRMHTAGTISDAQFDALKSKLIANE